MSPRKPVVNERIAERRAAVVAARRRTLRRRTLAVVALVVVVVGLVALERSSLVALVSLEVEGTRRLAADDVLAASEVEVGTSVLRISTGGVQQRVEAMPLVSRAEVRRDGALGLVIEVEEVAPALSARFDDSAVIVDAAGLVLGPGTAPGTPVVVLPGDAPTPGERIEDHPLLAVAHGVLLDLPGPVSRLVESAAARPPDDVELLLTDGTLVRWGDETRGGEKARALGAVLEDLDGRAVGRIDVRAPSAPTVSP